MPFPTNARIEVFEAGQQIGTGTSLAGGGGYSVPHTFTNAEDAPLAVVTIVMTFASPPTLNGAVRLHRSRINLNGQPTHDEPNPSTGWVGGQVDAVYVIASASIQVHAVEIPLESGVSGQQVNFSIENRADQTISSYEIWVAAKTDAPKT